MNEQMCFDFYNEPPQETLATYRGKVYTMVSLADGEDGTCEGCLGYGKGDFCVETEWACLYHHDKIWKEKT